MNIQLQIFGRVFCVFASIAYNATDSAAQAPAKTGDGPSTVLSPTVAVKRDEIVVREQAVRFKAAFDRGDSNTVAAMFAEEGEMIGPTGVALRGRKIISEAYRQYFDARKGATIALKVNEIRFLTKEVAQETGEATLQLADGSTESSRYTVLYVKRDGNWLQQEVRDYPVNGPQLSDEEKKMIENPILGLDWLIGDWVDESPDAVVSHRYRYMLNQRFIMREYSAEYPGEEPSNGVHVIGYDAQSKQFKSWGFDGEGSHGQAVWTRSGMGWVIKMNGVLGDGTPVSATQFMERANNGAIRVSSMDRTLGDSVQSDRDEILLVRKPPSAEAP